MDYDNACPRVILHQMVLFIIFKRMQTREASCIMMYVLRDLIKTYLLYNEQGELGAVFVFFCYKLIDYFDSASNYGYY